MNALSPEVPAYESFPYLTPGIDFPAIDLEPHAKRRSDYSPGLSPEESERVDRLMNDNPLISFHDHPQRLPANFADTPAFLLSPHEQTAFAELRASRLTAVFDNWFGVIGSTRRSGWKWDDLIRTLGLRLADLSRQEGAVVAHNVHDILDAHREQILAFVLGTESSSMIENDIDRIDVLYGFGIRQMGLVYSETNTLGSGQKEDDDGGLTEFGSRAVRRMNDLGILIDVSHAGDRTSYDAIRASKAPVGITHAGARSVWPTARMKPDDVLSACAERGGVLGIESAPHTTLSYDHRKQSLESMMDHFVYAVDLMGIEHVAFGPDTFYGDHVRFQDSIREIIGSSRVFDPGNLEYENVPHVNGAENPTETFRNIAGWLVCHDYSDSEIQAVLGGNILRLLKEVWR